MIWCFDCRNRRIKRGLSSGDWRLESRDPSRLETADRVDGGTLIARSSIELELGLRDNGFDGVEASGVVYRSGGVALLGVTMPILDALRFNSEPYVGVSRSSKTR